MTEVIRETTTTRVGGTVQTAGTVAQVEVSGSRTIEYLIYFAFGVLETLLAFRVVLKFLGANMSTTFVSLIYSLTQLFIMPFEGIFRRWFSQGLETTSVLEPATLVALVVYAFLAMGIVQLVRVLSREQQT